MKLASSAKVVPDRAKPTTQPVPWSTFRPRGHDFYNVVQQQQQQQRKVVELQDYYCYQRQAAPSREWY